MNRVFDTDCHVSSADIFIRKTFMLNTWAEMSSPDLICVSWKKLQPRFIKVQLQEHCPLPGLLEPLVESVGMLCKFLTQLVVFLLSPLLLLQLQLSLLHSHLEREETDASKVNSVTDTTDTYHLLYVLHNRFTLIRLPVL